MVAPERTIRISFARPEELLSREGSCSEVALRMSVVGLGRVKTPMFNLRVEIPSRFRKFENQKCLRPLLREDDRENNSAHSWLVHVFTQPGSIATELGCPRYVRFPPDSDLRSDLAGCLKRAISGSRAHSITSSPRASTLAGMVTRAALLAAILLHIARRPQHVDKGQARL